MKHKNGIRSRPIDDKKQLKVIKDLAKAKLDADNESLAEYNNIEKELYKVLEYYEKRKKIEIPKGKIINEKNDKNENLNTYCINNNIIYSNEISSNSQNLKHLNNTYILNYKLNEYKRPNNYIIYSSSQRNKNEKNVKEYEAKEADFIFLNFRDNFMNISELEDIMMDLENNATNPKDEKIDEEKAKNIMETKYSKYKNYAESIINYFKHRRNGSKKSLIRKKWLINKSTDKYLTTTFKKRGTDKIKTRKNTQNKQESLNKIIDAELLCKNNLLSMINNLYIKENLDQNLLKINEYIFLSECDKIKNAEISGNRIKENNSVKESIESITKNLKDKENDSNIPNEKSFKDHKNNNKANSNGNNTVNSNNRNINDITGNNLSNITDNKELIKDNKVPKNNNSNNEPGNSASNNKKILDRKNNNIKNKNDGILPNLSLDTLKNVKDSEYNYLKDKNNKFRVRIRINRSNKISVDRYIELKDDFNPFHDSYNDIINDYKKYDNDGMVLNSLEKKNFENLLNSYNLNRVKSLPLIESDDDSITLNNDIKQFSNSYKQFLKAKRTHT